MPDPRFRPDAQSTLLLPEWQEWLQAESSNATRTSDASSKAIRAIRAKPTYVTNLQDAARADDLLERFRSASLEPVAAELDAAVGSLGQHVPRADEWVNQRVARQVGVSHRLRSYNKRPRTNTQTSTKLAPYADSQDSYIHAEQPQIKEVEKSARKNAQRVSDQRMQNVVKAQVDGGNYGDQSELNAIARARSLDEMFSALFFPTSSVKEEWTPYSMEDLDDSDFSQQAGTMAGSEKWRTSHMEL